MLDEERLKKFPLVAEKILFDKKRNEFAETKVKYSKKYHQNQTHSNNKDTILNGLFFGWPCYFFHFADSALKIVFGAGKN